MLRFDRSRQVGTLIAVVLISGFNLFYFNVASADITIDGDFVHVDTDSYTVQFHKGSIEYIHNKLTDETYTLYEGKHGGTGVQFKDGDDRATRWASLVSAKQIDPFKAELLFQHKETEIRLFIAVDPTTDDLLIDVEGESDRHGVVGVHWGISRLDIQNLSVIAPMDGGRIITATTPSYYLRPPYPYSGNGWEAQLAIVQSKRGGFYVRNTDNTLLFKWFTYNRGDRGGDGVTVVLNFGNYNQAPFDTHNAGDTKLWRFNTYAGDWRVPARRYRDWMEQAFDAKRLTEKAAWTEDITLWTGGAQGSIPAQKPEVLDALATKVDPTKTVVMVKEWTVAQEWSRDPIDTEPTYDPVPELRHFCEVAKRHGFRVVLYTSMHACSPLHPLYTEFIQYHYRDPWTGELMIVRDPIRNNQIRDVMINVASSAFREIFVSELKEVWDTHDLDGFFLDTSYYAINDGNGLIEGLNSAQGGALLYRELAEAMPGAIFAGERFHEGTFALESFAQIAVSWIEHAEPHPISSFLFSPFTHFISGSNKNPDHDLVYYHTVLGLSDVWGIMPTLLIWKMEQFLFPEEWPNTHEVFARAGDWQPLYGLNGDINGDGQVNILDVVLVGQNLGATPLAHRQADVNGDGLVNVLDLILVANMFEGTR